MFPWQTEQQTLLTNKDLLGAFEQLRVKGYSWARFMVTLDEDFLPSFSSMVQPSETTTEVVPNLNENETLADKCTQQLNNDVEIGNEEKENCSKAFLDEFEYDYKADGSDLGGFDPDGSDLDDAFRDEGNNYDDLEDYKSGDDSRDELYDDIFEEQACNRYEKSAGGFEFSSVGYEIVLRP